MATRKEAKAALGSASAAGWHYVTLFRECRHRWFLRHVLGLVPKYYSRPLLFGQAFHEGCAVFYTAKKAKRRAGILAASKLLAQLAPLYNHADEFELDRQRLPVLVEYWIDDKGAQDLKDYIVVEAEHKEERRIPVSADGLFLTVRMDAVMRPRGSKGRNKIVIVEHKTTGYKADVQLDAVRIGGQAIAYTLAAKHLWPKATEIEVVPDVACWPRGSLDASRIDCVRGQPVPVTETDIEDFKRGVAQTLREINHGMDAFFGGKIEPADYFYRVQDPAICQAYAGHCDYFDVCRAHLEPGEQVFGMDWDAAVVARYRKLRRVH